MSDRLKELETKAKSPTAEGRAQLVELLFKSPDTPLCVRRSQRLAR